MSKPTRPHKRRKLWSSKASKEPFRLLGLPREIRDMIYRQHFEIASKVEMPHHQHHPVNAGKHRPVLFLLETCKQIYFEAYHMYYKYNMLAFPSTANLYSFLLGIGHARRQQITQIHVRWGWEPDGLAKEAFRLLRACGRLLVLYLTLTDMSNSRYLPTTAAALREVRGLKSIYVERQFLNSTRNRTKVRSPQDLTRYVTRPRLLRYLLDDEDEIDLFNQKPLRFRRTEPQLLSE
ncbi:hypothetical protein MMC30_004975 [Trapelia coarctata]|nr:hypothetical protein [Trapelia coarctata]